jgi:hypothetical protein
MRGNNISREVIHDLIELGVFGEMGFDVVPKDVLRGT